MHCPASIRRSSCVLSTAFLLLTSFAYAAAEEEPDHRLHDARCVIIIPAVKKGAFIVGGKYGRGFASCRKGERGRFGAPAAIRIDGLQIGGSSTDVFMLVMNESGMHRLLSDKFTIGGEAAATAGPVGRNASANTDVMLHAEILSWSRARGLFAGVSLEGSTLRPDESENRKIYGRDISNKEILQGKVSVPPAGRQLIVTLNRYSGRTTTREREDISTSLRTSGRVTLHAVHFASGKAELTSDSDDALNQAAQVLRDNPDWKIRVEGYTDSIGDKDSNRKLSDDRAQAVLNWLADHGVDRSRLIAEGYGEDNPVASNAKESGRQRNRRVDLIRE